MHVDTMEEWGSGAGIHEQMKYFFIFRLNIYIEFAFFILFGKIFHNLGALFRIDVPHILLVWH